MSFNKIILIVVALLPTAFFCFYTFRKDKAEKEPLTLLALLILAGVAIGFPAFYLERALEGSANNVIWFLSTKKLFSGIFGNYLHSAYKCFVCVAPVEEGLKWLVLYLVTKKNKNYNSLFDGILYSVFISLGFAGFENILYSLEYGFTTAFLRMITAVAIHMFCAISMGYYLTWYYVKHQAKANEKKLKEAGIIDKKTKEFTSRIFIVMSLVMPTLAHGFYNFCYNINKTWSTVIFCMFLGFLYVFCFDRVKRMSNTDMINSKYVIVLLYKKYPAVQKIIDAIIIKRREEGQENYSISFEQIIEFAKKSHNMF